MSNSDLYEFIISNRDEIIERSRQRMTARMASKESDTKLEHGIPIFLTQLAATLKQVRSEDALRPVRPADIMLKITDSAKLHGRDLLTNGLSVAQVVNGYGDVCQAVTELAAELDASISVQDFQLFNGCLDDAIAGAVTAYGTQREQDVAYEGTERLGVLAHELRNLMNTATLAFSVLKEGKVGLEGVTGGLLARSLREVSALIDRSLAEVRLQGGVPRLEPVSVAACISDVQASAALEAKGYGVTLTVDAGDHDVVVDADRQLLASALTNLVQNAFKFTPAGGHVSLTSKASNDRVSIEVGDECGGLPPGKVEELFQPFTRRGADSSGLGLGLSIARNAVRANNGMLNVRNIPGHGCVFSIDLPLKSALAHGA